MRGGRGALSPLWAANIFGLLAEYSLDLAEFFLELAADFFGLAFGL